MSAGTGKVLILGGTVEATALARLVNERSCLVSVTSLAGITRCPVHVPGDVRSGAFGGVDGLGDYLRRARIDWLVDATHPYAATMSRHAAMACGQTGVPRLQLWRPPWRRMAGDRWTEVANMAEAAAVLTHMAEWQVQRVFVTTGTRALDALAHVGGTQFVLRLIEPPAQLPLDNAEVVVARGPFTLAAELDLLERRRISVLLSKNSGGEATAAKIVAARKLGLPVILLNRPPPEAGPRAASAEEAFDWLTRHAG